MAKRKTISKQVRDKLLVDAMHRCCLCPEHHDMTDMHHIAPISEDGPNTHENLMVICPTCHAKIHRIRNRYNAEQLGMYKERWVRLCASGVPLDVRLAQALDHTRQPVPLVPSPYLAHPYPMPEHWTGRNAEMDTLDAWLKDDGGAPMCCLIAMGGMGKSSMAWEWLQKRVLPEQEAFGLNGIFQWSFYEGEVSFQRFLEDLTAYLGVSGASDPVTTLTQRLSQERVLLVLDGFERLLRAYASADAALLPERAADELETGERRCVEWPTVRLLRSLVAGAACKTLLISRLFPEDLDGLAGWLDMELTGLDSGDAVVYLRANGIKGIARELQDASAVYGYHPLSLSKLVNVLHYDVDQPDDIRQAPGCDVTADLKACQHHILERAYDTLGPDLGQFLSALAALRGKATMEVARFLAGERSDAGLSTDLRRLEQDRWVLWDRGAGTLDFHPVVRRYVYVRLQDKAETHARLAEYFQPLADGVDTQQVESVTDLGPVIELYHHTVRAGGYDEAHQLLRDRLHYMLYYRFGAYQTCIKLIRALFPDGEDRPPWLMDESDQAWTLTALANSYSLSGRPRRAGPLFETHNALQKKLHKKGNLAVGLGNLAYQQTILGELADAAENFRRSIELCREIEDEFWQAVARRDLGRLLVYKGAFDEAARELQAALTSIDKLGETQSVGIVWAYRALRGLLMGEAKAALEAARRAREYYEKHEKETGEPVERDLIRAEWLLGASVVALASEETDRKDEHLGDAETHLTEALTRCRRINLVHSEPDILLSWARWHYLKGDRDQACERAEEALAIADRSEYRLKQAEVHNFLARVAVDAGDQESAKTHAETAYKRAWCDGPPHCYRPALDEAEGMLRELGVEPEKQ